jgi:hypothetical protein
MTRALPLCLVLANACSDYGIHSPDDGKFPQGDTGAAGPLDDSEAPDTDPPVDSDDECYDPSSAYDMHPAAGLVVTQARNIVVAYQGSNAGFTSELWLSSPASVYLGTGHTTPVGATTDLGSFPPGTELVFSIRVTDTSDVFYSGPASRNADGFNHAAITYVGDCVWVVGFEDEYGGGDQDFNDIELSIHGPLEMQLVN